MITYQNSVIKKVSGDVGALYLKEGADLLNSNGKIGYLVADKSTILGKISADDAILRYCMCIENLKIKREDLSGNIKLYYNGEEQ